MSECTTTKRCPRCGESKPATPEYFHRNARNKDGLYPLCKPCRRADYMERYREKTLVRMKAYMAGFSPEKQERERQRKAQEYEANRERYIERGRYRRAKNPEERQRHDADYRERHREVTRQRNREYRLRYPDRAGAWQRRNPERVREIRRAFAHRNPEKLRAYVRNRRALLRGAKGTHTLADERRQYAAQSGLCWWCAQPVGSIYHVDHVIPIARGGGNGPDNLVISCPHCNQSRGKKLPEEWRR